jgi:hypothetical protein
MLCLIGLDARQVTKRQRVTVDSEVDSPHAAKITTEDEKVLEKRSSSRWSLLQSWFSFQPCPRAVGLAVVLMCT